MVFEKVRSEASKSSFSPRALTNQEWHMIASTTKATKKRASKMSARTIKLREQLWPTLDETLLWDRTTAKGFCTLPRTMPHIFEIINDLGGKGTPLSRVYFSLWCRGFDESLIEIKS